MKDEVQTVGLQTGGYILEPRKCVIIAWAQGATVIEVYGEDRLA